MTYRKRVSLFSVLDTGLILFSLFIAFMLVSEGPVPFSHISIITGILLISYHISSYHMNLYKTAWEYASTRELIVLLKTFLMSMSSTFVLQIIVFQFIHIELVIVAMMSMSTLIGGFRLLWRIFTNNYMTKRSNKRTLIIGAGSAGTMIARHLINNQETDLLPIAFVDDCVKKHHLHIYGIPVLGGMRSLKKIVDEYNIHMIIIAIPSLSKAQLNPIIKECALTNAKTQILPRLEDIVSGKVSFNQFRDIEVEDLLGREPVDLDIHTIASTITGKVVLVTGAGGSIGSEICRQIVKFKPRQLVLLGHGENSIYTIHQELKGGAGNQDIILTPEIADIQNAEKMMKVMSMYVPDVVYHAAAHKHVPMMERNPDEAISNNLIGTLNVAKASDQCGVHTFVMLSSDKAVNPTSVMGSTKRLAELVIQDINTRSRTNFTAVRFGNVLGSRGSVIPLFKNQIKDGGPVTITHPDMVRYFMTIPEASRLVIQAGALSKGGEIFVLDMGEPVKIVDLATNLIRLTGYSLDDIRIEYTGIREGEKLYEELLNEDEVSKEQIHPKIYLGRTSAIQLKEIEDLIKSYKDMENNRLRETLLQLANKKAEREVELQRSS
ncbi:nucleoside-diphosphate sugar epimerase/dehydratase [Pseudalkalibacillus sp. SCS-8]|uniref:polysaccharide biosynthesis protein n=1 Tax=Pseudalkalibacillus nanhaiensis TaxID=3115291 RepID=UPI0032D9F0C0